MGSSQYIDYMDKRAPSGFVGMRGKKEYDELVEAAKRAQMSGFFGTRGKKMPGRSSFFGMRGSYVYHIFMPLAHFSSRADIKIYVKVENL